MVERSTVFASGKIYWAKIIGTPRPNYENTGREWAYEFVPDDTSFLKEHGLLDRLKDKEDPKNPEKGDYLNLRKPEFTKDGKENEPIRIYDADNSPWDGRLLGNGTGADVKLTIVDYGKGKKKGIYTAAIRVTDLVPYESNEFGAFDAMEKGETEAKPKAKKPKKADVSDDFDDDVPF
jgi:CBS domain-containing protein